MSAEKMHNYHYTTLEGVLADVPAYATILWLKLANIVNPEWPTWEQWLFDHGWLLLLGFRLITIGYDLYLKLGFNIPEADKEKTRRHPVVEYIIKFIQKIFTK